MQQITFVAIDRCIEPVDQVNHRHDPQSAEFYWFLLCHLHRTENFYTVLLYDTGIDQRGFEDTISIFVIFTALPFHT